MWRHYSATAPPTIRHSILLIGSDPLRYAGCGDLPMLFCFAINIYRVLRAYNGGFRVGFQHDGEYSSI